MVGGPSPAAEDYAQHVATGRIGPPHTHTSPAAPPSPAAEEYAQHAARGYRPDRPARLPDALWEVVQACWREDPVERPTMAAVVAVMEEVMHDMPEDMEGCGCSVM